jgi:hypothetical protein
MRDGLVETKKAADAAAKSVEVARESTEFSKRALEISERAYLSLGIPVIDFTANEIGIDIENSGRIPASDFAAEIEQVWFTVTFKEGTPRTEGWRHPVFRVAWGDTPISQSSGLKFRVPSPKVRATVDKIKSPASDFFMVTVKGTYYNGFGLSKLLYSFRYFTTPRHEFRLQSSGEDLAKWQKQMGIEGAEIIAAKPEPAEGSS